MLKFTATPTPDFFNFDGTKITFKILEGEELLINRNGKTSILAKGQLGKTLTIVGEPKVSDEFSVGEKKVVFFEEAPLITPRILPVAPQIPQVIKTSPLSFIKKFIPQRKIVVGDGAGFEADSKNKKVTLSIGIILLAILVVSIGFGINQKNKKQKEEASAREIQEVKDREAAGAYTADTQLFLDLTLLSSGFKGDEISASGNNLYILDKNSKKIVRIEIENKKSEVVAGQGALNEAIELASYEDRVFVLDSEGVKEVDGDAKDVVEKEWDGEALIQAFAGNIYVLDKSANAIYRYSGSDGSFGSKQNWLASGTKAELGNATSWTFDGSIYVIADSRILKFSQGNPQTFSLPSEIITAEAIFADEENEFLYVLDKSGGKVFVVEKDGKFKAQYSSDEISQATGIVASEAEKKIILLTGEKLLYIEMRHL